MNMRMIPWTQKIPIGFDELIQVAQNLKLYQVGEIGPSHFQFKDEEGDKFRIQISQNIACSCQEKKINSHCIHSLFVLLKKFRVNQENPIIWQGSYIGSEIEDMINFKYSIQKKSNATTQSYLQSRKGLKKITKEMNNAKQSNRQALDSQSICPICQDQLHEDEALTFCRKKCGNNFHIKCLRVWIEHKSGSGDRITCPMCRTDITSCILEDIRKDEDEYNIRYVTHIGKRCQACSKKNILGNLFHCLNCENVDLCHFCFYGNQHSQHNKFLLKRRKDSEWEVPEPSRTQKALSSPTLPFLSIDPTQQQRFLAQKSSKQNTGISTVTDLTDYFVSCFSLFREIQQEQQITHPSGLSIVGQEMNKNKNTCSVCQTLDVQGLMRKQNCGHAIHTQCLKNAFIQQQHPRCQICNIPLLLGYSSKKSSNSQSISQQAVELKKPLKIERKKSVSAEDGVGIANAINREQQDLSIGGNQLTNTAKQSNFRIKKGIAILPMLSNSTSTKPSLSKIQKQNAVLNRAQEHKENFQSLMITGELSFGGREVISSSRQERYQNLPIEAHPLLLRNKMALPKEKKPPLKLQKNRKRTNDQKSNHTNVFEATISGQQIVRSGDIHRGSQRISSRMNSDQQNFEDGNIGEEEEKKYEFQNENQQRLLQQIEQFRQDRDLMFQQQQVEYNFTDDQMDQNNQSDQHEQYYDEQFFN